VDREARDARQTELLIRRFGQVGATVADAVPAFAGSYPTFGGLGNWGMFPPRWRILALADGRVQVWTAWTGPTPKKLLATTDRNDIVVEQGQLAYSRVTVAGHRLWIHRRDLASLEGWRDSD